MHSHLVGPRTPLLVRAEGAGDRVVVLDDPGVAPRRLEQPPHAIARFRPRFRFRCRSVQRVERLRGVQGGVRVCGRGTIVAV